MALKIANRLRKASRNFIMGSTTRGASNQTIEELLYQIAMQAVFEPTNFRLVVTYSTHIAATPLSTLMFTFMKTNSVIIITC